MNDWTEKVDQLDISLFQTIYSQSSDGDKRSLLAVQRAFARTFKHYAYLEIGSHLGGSIQPHLVDDRCRKIYSIDPRPTQQPDDRSPGFIAYYEDNSTARMLGLLKGIGYGNIAKIECFDLDASKVNPTKISDKPHIAFIDGEHTRAAVLSDFRFCLKILEQDGAILFHDFKIVWPAVLDILKLLNEQHRTFVAFKLEDDVFAIFFNSKVFEADPYLTFLEKRKRGFWPRFHIRRWVKQVVPAPILRGAKMCTMALGASAACDGRKVERMHLGS